MSIPYTARQNRLDLLERAEIMELGRGAEGEEGQRETSEQFASLCCAMRDTRLVYLMYLHVGGMQAGETNLSSA